MHLGPSLARVGVCIRLEIDALSSCTETVSSATARAHRDLFVQPGVATDFIDRKVHEMAVANGAYPSPLGYGGSLLLPILIEACVSAGTFNLLASG